MREIHIFHKRHFLALAIYGLFLVIQQSHATSLKIDGKLEYTISVPGQQIPPSLQNFSIQVDGCNWLMHITEASAEGASTNIIGCDGTNVYSISYLPSTAVKFDFSNEGEQTQPSPKKDLSNQATGSIVSGVIPSAGNLSAGVIWLTYASSYYFDSVKSNHVRLPYVGLDYPSPLMRYSDYSLPATFQRNDSDPHLLEFLDYKNEGITYNEVSGSLTTNSLQKPYDKGYTVARLESKDWTFFKGYHVPQTAVLTRYGRKKVATTAEDLNTFTKFKISAEKIAEAAPLTDYRPPIDVKIAIADMRTGGSASHFPIWYTLKNGHDWIPTETVVRLPTYQRQINTKKRTSEPPSNGSTKTNLRIILIFIFISLTSAALIVYLSNKSKFKGVQ